MSHHLTRFDPISELSQFSPWRSAEEFLRSFPLSRDMRDLDTPPPIRLDITETEQAYTVKADMPGVNKDDIKIDLDGNRVSIATEVKRETDSKPGATPVRVERYVGQSYRSFILEHEVDDSNAHAAYRDGILELTLPKRPNGKGSKRLTIA